MFYGSAGNGSSTHLNMELLKSLAGIDLIHVPYKGSTQSRTDLLAGQIQLTVDGLLPTLPHVRAGKLKAIALASSRRSAVAPEIPTIAEAGVAAYQTDTWYALFAPAGISAEPTDPSPGKLEELMRADLARWSKLVTDAKLKVD